MFKLSGYRSKPATVPRVSALCFFVSAALLPALLPAFQLALAEPADDALKQAMRYRDSGNYRAAEMTFEGLRKAHPHSVKFLREEAQSYINEHKFEKALLLLDQALGEEPNNIDLHQFRGNVCVMLVQPKKALYSFQRIISLDPKSFIGYLGVASSNSMLGNTRVAQEYIAKARAHGAPAFNCLLVQLDCYQREKQYDQSIAACTRLLKDDPKQATVYYLRARLYNQLHQFEKALPDLRKAEECHYQPLVELYYLRGAIFQQTGLVDEAVIWLNKSLAISPTKPEALACRAFCYLQEKQFKKSEADCLLALKALPHDALTLSILGRCYDREKRYADAVKQFNLAIASNPQFYFAYQNRGETELHMGNYAQAVKDFTVVIEHDPRPDFGHIVARLRANVELKNYSAALVDLDHALKLHPESPEVRATRARCMVGLKQTAVGRKEIEVITSNHSENLSVWRDRLWIETTVGNKPGMVASLKAITRLDPQDSNARALLNRLGDIKSTDTSDRHEQVSSSGAKSDPSKSASKLADEKGGAVSFIRRGRYHLKSLEGEKAIADFNAAIALAPKFARAYVYRGLAYRSIEKYDQAFADFNKALQINGADGEARLNLARLHSFLRQLEPALKDYDKLITLGPPDTAYLERAELLLALNKPELALSDCQQAVTLHRGVHELKSRGDVFAKLNRNKEAIADYSEAMKFTPKDSQLHRLRGAIYTKLGDSKLASQDLQLSKQLDSEL